MSDKQLPDLQNQQDIRGIALDKVGITNVYIPIRLLTKPSIENSTEVTADTSARVRLFVGLPKDHKGVNMCYDDETEVLTKRNSWVLLKDLDKEDIVATLNLLTEDFEWQKPDNYYVNDYSGKLFTIEGNHLNLSVTPNHNLVVRNCHNKNSELELVKADRVYDKTNYNMYKGCVWRGTFPEHIELSASWVGGCVDRGVLKVRKFETFDFMKLLGLYLTGGCSVKPGKGATVYWTGQDDILNKEIFDILKKVALKPVTYTSRAGAKGVRCSSRTLHMYFSSLGKSIVRSIPEEIRNLDSKYLQILLNYYLLGNGSKPDNQKNCSFYSYSKLLADNIQEIGLKCGKACNIKPFNCGDVTGYRASDLGSVAYAGYFNSKLELFFNCSSGVKTQVKNYWREYEGLIYCCSVPNATLLVRRKGVYVWSGNSRFMECLVSYCEAVVSPSNMLRLLTRLQTKLKSSDAYARFEFDFYKDKVAPVSLKSAPQRYRCAFTGVSKDGVTDFIIELNVVGASVCPCSKEMNVAKNLYPSDINWENKQEDSDTIFSKLQSDEAGLKIGMGAHNQRSNVRVRFIAKDNQTHIWLEDIIELIEAEFSVSVYPILKRPDEKFVTEQGYKNAKFSEDITRDIQIALEAHSLIKAWDLRVFNEESIHPYDVTCYQKSSNWKY